MHNVGTTASIIIILVLWLMLISLIIIARIIQTKRITKQVEQARTKFNRSKLIKKKTPKSYSWY